MQVDKPKIGTMFSQEGYISSIIYYGATLRHSEESYSVVSNLIADHRRCAVNEPSFGCQDVVSQ